MRVAWSKLLAQSGTDHSDVNAAGTNVEGCKGLTADAQTFNKAATNRRTLLSKLAQLPGICCWMLPRKHGIYPWKN